MLSTESIGSEKVHDYVTSSALTIKKYPPQLFRCTSALQLTLSSCVRVPLFYYAKSKFQATCSSTDFKGNLRHQKPFW
jgi:hypothetical protein